MRHGSSSKILSCLVFMFLLFIQSSSVFSLPPPPSYGPPKNEVLARHLFNMCGGRPISWFDMSLPENQNDFEGPLAEVLPTAFPPIAESAARLAIEGSQLQASEFIYRESIKVLYRASMKVLNVMSQLDLLSLQEQFHRGAFHGLLDFYHQSYGIIHRRLKNRNRILMDGKIARLEMLQTGVTKLVKNVAGSFVDSSEIKRTNLDQLIIIVQNCYMFSIIHKLISLTLEPMMPIGIPHDFQPDSHRFLSRLKQFSKSIGDPLVQIKPLEWRTYPNAILNVHAWIAAKLMSDANVNNVLSEKGELALFKLQFTQFQWVAIRILNILLMGHSCT